MRLCASTAPSARPPRELELPNVLALLVGSRDDDGLDTLLTAEPVEQPREERVRPAVVQGDVRRRPHEDEDVRLVEAELVQRSAIGLEVGQVVLLLQARVAAQLRRADAVAFQPLGRDRLGDEHARRGPAAELVLHHGELVVERVAARDAQGSRGEGQVVGAVRQRDVEPARLGPGAERTQARDHGAELGEARTAAVPPEQLGLEPVQLQQVDRLRVVARRDLDLVPAGTEKVDQRPEHQHVSRRSHVDPDSHRP